jgi:hypothetical protein
MITCPPRSVASQPNKQFCPQCGCCAPTVKSKNNGVHLKSRKVHDYLTSLGYVCQPGAGRIISFYDCCSGDQTLTVTESLPTPDSPAFSIGLSADSPLGWADFRFIALSEDEVIETRDECSIALLGNCAPLRQAGTQL